MNRIFSGFLIGLPITFMLMLLMSMLIETKADTQVYTRVEPPVVDDVMPDTEVGQIVDPRELPAPEPIQQEPFINDVPTEPTENTEPKILDFVPPDIEGTIARIPHDNIHGRKRIVNENHINQDAIPTIISEPRWPRGATTGGYVRLCFSVMPDGSVANVVVANSQPGRTFVKSAKRAVYRWKFKPTIVDGQAIEESNMCYTMKFEMEN